MSEPAEDMFTDEAVYPFQNAPYIEPLYYSIPFVGIQQIPTNGFENIVLARMQTQVMFPTIGEDMSSILLHNPTTGMENIAIARQETEHIFLNTDFSIFQSMNQAAKPSSPLKQWKIDLAHTFSSLALNLKGNKNKLLEKFPPMPFPPVENERKVFIFCLGSNSYEEIFENENVPTVDGHVPLLSYVLYLSQQDILTILRYFNKWLKQVGMNDSICRWLYSLLACLNKPVSDECENFLQFFYEECAEKIKNSNAVGREQLHCISAILKTYFCVTSRIEDSLETYSGMY